eukprot:CAMPEP_0169433992 /NCGR_PEP_ID=MMETSP1042-20121227/4292_1 /TAXON_ID=464988 /ORGANISM="Hemiselmis andersenii, Strain CCMP1180" /LENGTH=78 /DNA_ID=CAMNT_0009544539 /DNA_START=599 /DNA_END=835 /DNA_ORIENTATION=-
MQGSLAQRRAQEGLMRQSVHRGSSPERQTGCALLWARGGATQGEGRMESLTVQSPSLFTTVPTDVPSNNLCPSCTSEG